MSSSCKTTNMSLDISSDKFKMFTNEKGSSDLVEKLQTFFSDDKFCDVTVTDANGEIQVNAHRLILAARSEYFALMFGSSFKEAKSKEVKFENIDGKTLEMVIRYMYSNTIKLETDTVEDVLKAAHLLQIKPLEEACCDFLTNQIDTWNVAGVLSFAEQYSFTNLCEYAFEFALQHFMELRRKKDFFSLDVHQLRKLISNDRLQVYSEEEVFHAILSWVDHDQDQRQQLFEELFAHIRLTCLPPKFIASTVEPAIKSTKCMELIRNSYKWHFMPKLRQSLVPEQQTRRRSLKEAFFAIDGFEIADQDLRVSVYSSALNEWFYTECQSLPEPRSSYGTRRLDEKIIFAGGYLGNREITNRVDCLDLKTFQWTQLPPLLTARYNCKATTLNGHLYVIGGIDRNHEGLNSVEKWDPLIGKWEYITPMIYAVTNLVVCVKGSSLCVAHYQNNDTIFDIYDPLTKEWTYDWARAPFPVLNMRTVSLNEVDYLCAVSFKEIKLFNLENNSTKTIQLNDMDDTFCTAIALSCGSFMTFNKSSFRKYCPVKNKWEMMPDLEMSESGIPLFYNNGFLLYKW